MKEPPSEALTVILETRRFRLRPLTDADVTPEYVCWMNDPDVVRYLDSRYMPQTAATIRRYLKKFDGIHSFIWAICDKQSTTHIGNATLYVDWVNRLAEPGCLIGVKAYWGKNVLLEVYVSIFDYVFFELRMEKLWAKTRTCNYSAIWNLRKLGMTFEAELHDHVIFEDRRVNLLVASIFKEQWLDRRLKLNTINDR